MPVKLNSTGGGSVTLDVGSTATNFTQTLPSVTTTLVGTDATQTLTNKTLGSGLVMGASAITLGTAQASTSGTNIDFTGIPSWVRRVTVMLNAVSVSGSSAVQIQIGTSSGVETSGYAGTTQTSNAGGNAVTSATAGVLIDNGTAAGAAATRNVLLTACLVSGNIWILSANWAYSNTAIVGTATYVKTLSGVLDRVRITTTDLLSTFDAGSINIMYE